MTFHKNITLSIPASWKTTLAGIISLALAIYRALHEPTWSAAIHDPQFQTEIILGILGLISKDWNATGGTVPATPEAEARVAADNKSPNKG